MNINLSYSDAQHFIFHESAEQGRFRIFPKGRRLGATRGAAHAFIEFLLENKACLWVDTINGNIDRYVERYFIKALKANRLPYAWHQQKRLLTLPGFQGFIDFRSADRPENIEGFGYHVIFLNEAGIILDDDYLYTNAVLPMMIDYPDSTLIAAGTPKLRQGTGRLFQELWARVERGEPGYVGKRFTTWDNPFLPRAQIDTLVAEIPDSDREQEVYGRFVEQAGSRVKREWITYGTPTEIKARAMGVDLAISTKSSADYSAIVVVELDQSGVIYVRHAERRRAPFHQVLQFIIEVAAAWKPDVIAIEQVQYQAAVVQELLRTTRLPVKGVTPSKDKISRFAPLEVRYEQQMIQHDPNLPRYLLDELLAFPPGPGGHDDLCDALSYSVHALPTARPSKINLPGGLHRASPWSDA